MPEQGLKVLIESDVALRSGVRILYRPGISDWADWYAKWIVQIMSGYFADLKNRCSHQSSILPKTAIARFCTCIALMAIALFGLNGGTIENSAQAKAKYSTGKTSHSRSNHRSGRKHVSNLRSNTRHFSGNSTSHLRGNRNSKRHYRGNRKNTRHFRGNRNNILRFSGNSTSYLRGNLNSNRHYRGNRKNTRHFRGNRNNILRFSGNSTSYLRGNLNRNRHYRGNRTSPLHISGNSTSYLRGNRNSNRHYRGNRVKHHGYANRHHRSNNRFAKRHDRRHRNNNGRYNSINGVVISGAALIPQLYPDQYVERDDATGVSIIYYDGKTCDQGYDCIMRVGTKRSSPKIIIVGQKSDRLDEELKTPTIIYPPN